MKEGGWESSMGKPTTTSSKKKISSADNPARGRVAIETKETWPTFKGKESGDTIMLEDEGRWHETCVAVDDGRKYCYTASMFCIDGASSDATKYRRNEELIARALKRMLEVGASHTS